MIETKISVGIAARRQSRNHQTFDGTVKRRRVRPRQQNERGEPRHRVRTDYRGARRERYVDRA